MAMTINIEAIYTRIADKFDIDRDAGDERWYLKYIEKEAEIIKAIVKEELSINYGDTLRIKADMEKEDLYDKVAKLQKENDDLKEKYEGVTPEPNAELTTDPTPIDGKKYKCECGMVLAHNGMSYINRHKKTKKHVNRMLVNMYSRDSD